LVFQDASVDLVVSHGLIHHLRDLPKFFSEINRILKPNALAYLTDLRRDAPEQIIKEVEANLPSSQAKAFINSVAAAYISEELKQILDKSGIKNFKISGQRFSRDTILKNKDKLRRIITRSADYTQLSQTIIIKKEE
jgi:SAM-dependent methyltransferase